MIVCVPEETEVEERVECGSHPERGEEVEEEKEGGEGEGEEREGQAQSCSRHPEPLATVHGGKETIRGYVCPPQSKATPVSQSLKRPLQIKDTWTLGSAPILIHYYIPPNKGFL